MPISRSPLPHDLVQPILQCVTRWEDLPCKPTVLACSLVCSSWRNEALSIFFAELKVEPQEPEIQTLDHLRRFLGIASINPALVKHVRRVTLHLLYPLQVPTDVSAHDIYHIRLSHYLTLLCQAVTNVQEVSVRGTSWIENLRPESRAAIRTLCRQPHVRRIHDDGMGVPISVWISNPSINQVRLSLRRVDKKRDMDLELSEAPPPSEEGTKSANITDLTIGPYTDLQALM